MRLGLIARATVAFALVSATVLAAAAPASADPWDSILEWETARVTRIVDGDTMIVTDVDTGEQSRIRLIGINAPEKATKSKPGQCGWWQAKNALADLAPEGSVVKLASASEASTGARNRPQRVVLAYDDATGKYDIDAAWGIAEAGWALWFTTSHEATMSALYQQVVADAQRRQVGLWSTDLCGQRPAPDAQIDVRIGRAPPRTGVAGEWVSVRNAGTTLVDLSDWMLREGGLQGWFVFPAGTVLSPGDYRVVHTGSGDASYPDGHDLYAGARSRLYPAPRSWPALIGDGAYLLDPAGAYRFWREYPCPDTCAPDPLDGVVIIDAVSIGSNDGSARAQWIRLANHSASTVCLDGYRIATGVATYYVPPGTCISPNGTWTLHGGEGRANGGGAFWGRSKAPLAAAGTITLTSDRGQVVATGTW